MSSSLAARRRRRAAALPASLTKARSFAPAEPHARSLAGDDDIRILSAKHGLVSFSASLESNDTCFGQEGRISHDELARQAKAAWLAAERRHRPRRRPLRPRGAPRLPGGSRPLRHDSPRPTAPTSAVKSAGYR